MSGQYSGGVANIDVYLKSHSASTMRTDRAKRKAHLDKPALTFGLAIQPGILADTAKIKRFRDSGLLARFLYAIPKNNVGTRNMRNARVFVVNQNPINSVGFSQALRLRYDRPDLSGCALSLSPTLKTSSVDRVVVLGPDSIRLVRENGVFMVSFVERFHRFAEPPSTLAVAARQAGLHLLNAPRTYESLMALDFRFPHPLNDPRIEVFCWDNHRVRRRQDLLWIESLTELTRCRLFTPRDARSPERESSVQGPPARQAE